MSTLRGKSASSGPVGGILMCLLAQHPETLPSLFPLFREEQLLPKRLPKRKGRKKPLCGHTTPATGEPGSLDSSLAPLLGSPGQSFSPPSHASPAEPAQSSIIIAISSAPGTLTRASCQPAADAAARLCWWLLNSSQPSLQVLHSSFLGPDTFQPHQALHEHRSEYILTDFKTTHHA